MATTETQIVNSALIKMGAEPVNSIDDNSVRARTMKALFYARRDALLESHPWNFAISYVELAAVDPTPSDIEWEYEYVFQLPADCLRVLKTDLSNSDDWEQIEGNRIACNVSELKVKFIKKIEDVSQFSSRFCETLSHDLAADGALTITGSSEKSELAIKNYEKYLAQTRSFDAQVGSVKRVEADDWFNARRY